MSNKSNIGLRLAATAALLFTATNVWALEGMQRIAAIASVGSFHGYKLGMPQNFAHLTDLSSADPGALAVSVDPPVKDDLFAGTEKFAKGAKSSTEINLDPNMLSMAGGKGNDSDLVKKMQSVVIRTYEYAKTGDYNMADVLEFTRRLDEGGWNHLVRERSDKEISDICIRVNQQSETTEMVIIAAEPKELTFIHLKGRMSMEDLMKAGKKYGAPAGDTKLEKRK